MRFIKPAAAALAVAIGATAFVPAAEARDGHFYRHGQYHNHRHDGFGAFGAGVAGFAAGAFLGSLAGRDYYDYGYAPGYYYQQPGYYYAPAPIYVAPPRAYYRQQPRYDVCDSGGGVTRPATAMC